MCGGMVGLARLVVASFVLETWLGVGDRPAWWRRDDGASDPGWILMNLILNTYRPYEVYQQVIVDYINTRIRTEPGTKPVWSLDASWPAAPVEPGTMPGKLIIAFLNDGESHGIYQIDDTVVDVRIQNGRCSLSIYGTSQVDVEAVRAKIQLAIPERIMTSSEVGVNFWSLGPQGPTVRHRLIQAPTWNSIRPNYPSPVADDLGALIPFDADDDRSGRLILWTGLPGTGKTYALRSLALEMKDDLRIDYVVDPDKFFAEGAYMMSVIMDEHEAKAKLLVLEDSGEYISADARTQVGHGLSRLLNMCDGLIGQGLNLYVLITTNEETGKLHEAATRAGRCRASIQFQLFGPAQASSWLGEEVSGSQTLADLYAMRETRSAKTLTRMIGF